MTSEDIKRNLVREASEAGFDVCRVVSPDAVAEAGAHLDAFLAAGHHGDMAWMARHADRRRAPRNLWPEVQAVVMLGMNYAGDENPLEALTRRDRAAISVYAQRRDYHLVMKKKLKALAHGLIEAGGGDAKIFVDTAPVMEKPLAAAAGLGWQGKHTNLVSRDFGSWLFLGSIFTTLALPPDTPETDHCGSCRACLDICPTDAFPAPYKLDARRCISYLTIEHGAPIAREFRKPIGNRIYGCDDCLAVCPWNKYAQLANENAVLEDLRAPPLAELVRLDDAAFRARFAGTPIKRTGRARFIRNVLIAIGNLPEAAAFVPLVEARLDDEAALVRGMAVWALGEIDRPRARALAKAYLPRETDAHVRDEWQEL